MPGAPHEILIMALRERPALLATLLERLEGKPAPAALRVVDSALRFADVKDVRPDLVLTAPELPWVVLEVQHAVDEVKQRRWPLVAAVLLDEHRAMGELVVLTTQRRVARWAARAVRWVGRLGTRLSLTPLVLRVDLDAAERLLSEPEPELALVAAWALGPKHGPRARRLAQRALERTAGLAEPVREQQIRAILQLLGVRLREHLQAMWLKDLDKVPQSKSYRAFVQAISSAVEARAVAEGLAKGKAEGLAKGKAEGLAKGKAEGLAKGKAEGLAKGKAEAVLAVLEARGLAISDEERARLLGCTDLDALERWVRKAVTVKTAAALFAAPKRRAKAGA
jgi:hypothetical protein